MKKFCLIFILIFSLSFFCGCKSVSFALPSNCIFSSINFFANGEISQTIAIGVDSEKIDSLAKSGEGVQFKSNLVKQMENLRQKFLLSFALVYLQNPIEQLKIGSGVKFTATSYRQQEDVICFEMVFSSSVAWQYYHNTLNNDLPQNNEQPFLIAKQISTSAFPFSGTDANGSKICESYKSMYVGASEGLSFDKYVQENYNPTYVYCYSTFSNKIKSDATYKFINPTGQYCHVWVADEDMCKMQTTSIYYYQINKGNWLMLSLALPSLGLASYCTYKIIKTRKKRRE